MFKTFPEFSKLTLSDRAEYEEFVKGCPPIASLSFPGLLEWWGTVGDVAVSRLNGSLVIAYWIPGFEKYSGVSIIGTKDVDESLCTVFDYLRGQGERPRVVSVPEFVVNHLQYPELFSFKTSRGDDEYLIAMERFAVLDNMPRLMRIRARKFERRFAKQAIQVKPIDLSSVENQRLLIDAVADWPRKGLNNINKLEREALPRTLERGAAYGLRNICIFIDGEVQAFCLYHVTQYPDHAIAGHARINYDFAYLFDYSVHAFCKYLADKGVAYVNIHADNDSAKMRTLKMVLRPDNFFRKYSIEPAMAGSELKWEP